MRKLATFSLSLFTFIWLPGQSLRGHVIDSLTHMPLSGVSVYFPQLKLGGITDINGNYRIWPFPKGIYEGEVQMIGYSTLTKQITIKGDEIINFSLVISYSSLRQVL